MSIANAKETCSCGAEIELEMEDIQLFVHLAHWRKNHKHELAVFAPSEQTTGGGDS